MKMLLILIFYHNPSNNNLTMPNQIHETPQSKASESGPPTHSHRREDREGAESIRESMA